MVGGRGHGCRAQSVAFGASRYGIGLRYERAFHWTVPLSAGSGIPGAFRILRGSSFRYVEVAPGPPDFGDCTGVLADPLFLQPRSADSRDSSSPRVDARIGRFRRSVPCAS